MCVRSKKRKRKKEAIYRRVCGLALTQDDGTHARISVLDAGTSSAPAVHAETERLAATHVPPTPHLLPAELPFADQSTDSHLGAVGFDTRAAPRSQNGPSSSCRHCKVFIATEPFFLSVEKLHVLNVEKGRCLLIFNEKCQKGPVVFQYCILSE